MSPSLSLGSSKADFFEYVKYVTYLPYHHWIYPGPFKVERQLINYPLSRDTAKLVALKDDLALYRLAFGQPRQEDLLDFLKRRGVDSADTAGIDLRPDAIRPPNSAEADQLSWSGPGPLPQPQPTLPLLSDYKQ